MGIKKGPTTSILSACLALAIVFALCRTFALQEHTPYVRGLHSTSMTLTQGHLQTRRIKPQTLPKPKVIHPLLHGGPFLRRPLLQSQRYTYSSAKAPTSDEHPFLLPTDIAQDQASPQLEVVPVSVPDTTNPAQVEGQAPPDAETKQEDAPKVEEEKSAKPLVTCSRDMSLPCFPER